MKKARLYLKLLIMLFFIIIAFFYAITFNNEVGWVVLSMVIFFSLSIIFSLFVPLNKISFKDLETIWVKVDEKKEIRLEIQNRAFFVPILIIKNKDLQIKEMFSLFIPRNQSIQAEWLPKNRGFMESLVMEVQSSDFFSILKKRRNIEVSAQMYIFPKEHDHVKHIIDLFEPSIKKNLIGESSFELEKIRLYLPGDLIRGIDWKLSSKKQQLIYREYELYEDNEILFIFYGTKSKHFEWLLSIYFGLYKKYSDSRHRFVLIGAGIKQRENIKLTDFCLIENKDIYIELSPFKEKYLVVFAPELSKNLETILTHVSSSVVIQLIDHQVIEGRTRG